MDDGPEETENEHEKRALQHALESSPHLKGTLEGGGFLSEADVAAVATATGYLPKQVKRACTAFRNAGAGREGKPSRHFHFIFHKPTGVYAQPQPYNPKAKEWKTLSESLPPGFPSGLPSAGRLDAETQGLVFFSDDRWLLHLLSQGTRGKAAKTYHVWCSRIQEEKRMEAGEGANDVQRMKVGASPAGGDAGARDNGDGAAADTEEVSTTAPTPTFDTEGLDLGEIFALKREEATKARTKLEDLCGDIRDAIDTLRETQDRRERQRESSGSRRQATRGEVRNERQQRKRKQEAEGWAKALEVLRAPLQYQNGVVTRPADDVRLLREESATSAIFEVTISEGRNHQVRRLCAAAGKGREGGGKKKEEEEEEENTPPTIERIQEDSLRVLYRRGSDLPNGVSALLSILCANRTVVSVFFLPFLFSLPSILSPYRIIITINNRAES